VKAFVANQKISPKLTLSKLMIQHILHEQSDDKKDGFMKLVKTAVNNVKDHSNNTCYFLTPSPCEISNLKRNMFLNVSSLL